jgi:rifampicin phosphotransferase
MVYQFSKKQIPLLSEVGGKAKALIETTNKGFNVPDGFVLSVKFFENWIVDLKGTKVWVEFLKKPSEENCIKLKKIAAKFIMDREQKERLSNALKKFTKQDIFAVRSSSPDEDLEGASFAGGYETTLGVIYTKLEKAIIDSFISMLDYRVVEYKKKHNIDIDKPSIAIIVQKQIASDVSGVGFSANPQTGALDEVMLNSSFGLGETIVSGIVNPDIYIIKKEKIISKKISNKHIALYLKEDGGTQEKIVKEPKKESLTKKQAIDLSNVINKVESWYKKPMDTEWAIADNKIYLLQARPITTKMSKLSWDVGIHPKGTMFARGSIIEMLPDPLAPLYADYAKPHVVSSLKKLVDELFDNQDLLESMKFFVLNGYGYLQFTLNKSIYWFSLINIRKMLTVFKAHPDWVEKERLPAIKARLAELKKLDLENLETKKLYDISHELTETICVYFTYCQIYLAQAYMSEGIFSRFYKKKIKPKTDIPYHILMLGDDTAPIIADKALYMLAQEIKKDAKTKKFILTKSSDYIREFVENRENKEDSFYKKFNFYLDAHANMIYDLDFSKTTPHNDARPIIKALKLYVEGKGADPIKRQNESLKKRKEAEKKIKELVSSSKYYKFMKKLTTARFSAPFRENGLANMGVCQPFLREVFFELGKRLKSVGVIESYEDIFWFTENELADFKNKKKMLSLVDEVKLRKEKWKEQKRENPPPMLPKGVRILGIKVSSFLPKDLEENVGDNRYEGNGVSSGKITGKAKVILSPEEFSTMDQGDILVTSMTTPAWTPLFALASGIVADFGGPLSHTSIVAREYGIPAVLGTGGLSKIIKTGQTITVDADNNVVIIGKIND